MWFPVTVCEAFSVKIILRALSLDCINRELLYAGEHKRKTAHVDLWTFVKLIWGSQTSERDVICGIILDKSNPNYRHFSYIYVSLINWELCRLEILIRGWVLADYDTREVLFEGHLGLCKANNFLVTPRHRWWRPPYIFLPPRWAQELCP